MSIIQVAGSTRIDNTIYLAVASLYWTAVLDLLGVEISLTVETTLLIIPISTGIAVFLWAFEFERLVINRIVKTLILRNKKQYEILIATLVIFIKPWQSLTTTNAEKPGEILKNELDKVMDGITFKDDLEKFYQLFWIFWAIFPFLFLIRHISEILIILFIPLSVLCFSIVAAPILRSGVKRAELPLQVILTKWLNGLIISDERRRQSVPFLRKLGKVHQPTIRKTLITWTNEAISKCDDNDWKSFDFGFSQIIDFIHMTIPYVPTDLDFDDFIRDIIWYSQQNPFLSDKVVFPEKYPRSERYTPIGAFYSSASMGMAKEVILESLKVLEDTGSGKTFYENYCSDNDKKWITPASKLLDFILKEDKDDHEILVVTLLDTFSFGYLQPETLVMIRNIPFHLRNLEEPQSDFTVQSFWPKELASYLVMDVENEVQLLEAAELIRCITKWEVKPISIVDAAGKSISQTYLETNFDLNPTDLIPCLESFTKKSKELDQAKVIRMLEYMQEKPEFDILLDCLRKIAGGKKSKKYREVWAVVEYFSN